MSRYIVRRLLLGLVTIWLVTVIVFSMLHVVVPIFYGDVVDIMVGEYGGADGALGARYRAEYGFDRPVPVQYVSWFGGILRGDFGRSLYNNRPVTWELGYRVPVSLTLSLVGLGSAIFLAVPMGLIAAVKQDQWPDYLLRIWAVGTSAMPNFWIAILIITFGTIWFNWAPSVDYAHIWENPMQHFRVMLLPALLIGLTPSGGLMRIMRAQMLEVLRQDYVRTARAKGLAERIVIARHGLRNALIPVVTIIGLSLPALIAGTALFEIIFVLPGMGLYLVSAVRNLDYPVILATNLIFATLIISSNLVVDIAYSYIDPRIRYQ